MSELQCVACGQPAAKTWRVKVSEGFNVLLAHVERVRFVDVPVCGRCARRRFLASFVTPTAVILGVAGGATATAAAAADWIDGSTQLRLIFAALAWILIFVNFGRRWIDYWILGLRGASFTEDGVVLLFRHRPTMTIRTATSSR